MLPPPPLAPRRSTLAPSRPLCLGMEGPQEPLAVAYGAQEDGAAVISRGPIGPRPCAFAPRVRKQPSKATPRSGVYAAGPCGSWLSRYLTTKGSDGGGGAPALMPPKARERVTTHRRAAGPLARLARSGALPLGAVPQGEEAARGARPRARADPRSARQAAQCRRPAFWRSQALRDAGRAHGGPAPLRWLSDVVGPPAAQPIVLQADVRARPASPDRRPRRAQALHAPGPGGRWPPVGAALPARRGVPCPGAVTLVAALGDGTRVEPPRERRQGLGLRPAAYSTGAQRQQGALTKAGPPPARRALGAGAWASRYPATGRRHRQRCLAQQPPVLPALRWPAPGRLWRRARRLGARDPPAPVVTGALARERASFRWALAQQGPVTPSGHRSQRACTPHSAGGRRASAQPPPRGGGPRGGVQRLGAGDACRA